MLVNEPRSWTFNLQRFSPPDICFPATIARRSFSEEHQMNQPFAHINIFSLIK